MLKESKFNNKFAVFATVAVLAVMAGVLIIGNSKSSKIQEQIDLGNKYLEEMNYEEAVITFIAVIETEPKSVEAYLGLVEVYIRTGEFDTALEYAQKGYEMTGDNRLKEKIEMIESGNIEWLDGRKMMTTAYNEEGAIVYIHKYTYDEHGRIQTKEHYNGEHVLINRIDYVFDEAGRMVVGEGWISTDTGEIGKCEWIYEDELCIGKIDYYEDYQEWMFYEHDDNGNAIKTIYGRGMNINSIEEMEGYSLKQFDKEGRVIREENYSKDNELTSYFVYEYKNDKLSKFSVYDGEGNLSQYQIYEYNNGELIKSSTYDGEGNLERYQIHEGDEIHLYEN